MIMYFWCCCCCRCYCCCCYCSRYSRFYFFELWRFSWSIFTPVFTMILFANGLLAFSLNVSRQLEKSNLLYVLMGCSY